MAAIGRRVFLKQSVLGAAGLLSACGGETTAPRSSYGRLTSRRTAPTSSITPGSHTLGLPGANDRDGLLYIPAGYKADVPAPLLVMLHGGGGSGADWADVPALTALLDELGCVMLAPDSRNFTWDGAVATNFGVDVTFVDQALAETFRRCNVDAAAISIAGFSDGATESLGLGVMNGDLFSGVIAFSPGWFDVPTSRGTPRVFISHGTDDNIFDAGWTRTYIVPTLEGMSLDVEYVEFAGGHTLPAAILDQAMRSHVG